MKYLILLAVLAVSACDMAGMGATSPAGETSVQKINDDAGSNDDGDTAGTGQTSN